MKKTRFLSMLLAAALAVSSLPLVAFASSAPDSDTSGIAIGTDLLEGVTPSYSASAINVNVNDNNGYLHLYDRVEVSYDSGGSKTWVAMTPGVGYRVNGTLSKDVVYYASFDIRTSVNTVAQNDVKTNNATISLDESRMYHLFATGFDTQDIIKNAWGSSFNKRVAVPSDCVDTSKAAASAHTFKHNSNTGAAAYSGGGLYNLLINPEWFGENEAAKGGWQNYEFTFIPAANATNPFFAIYRGAYHYRSVPIDVDNFKIWYYNNGENTPTYVVNQSFDSVSTSDVVTFDGGNARIGKFFTTNNASGWGTSAKLTVAHEVDYTEVPAPDGTASITYSFGDGIEIDAGAYQFTGDARLDFHDPIIYEPDHDIGAVVLTSDDNTADVTVTIETDDGSYESESRVISEWGALETIIVINEEPTVLKSLTITMDDDARKNKSLDINNVKFVKTAVFSSVDGEDSTAEVVYDVVESAITSDGDIVSKYPSSFEPANKYLHVTGRFNNREGLLVDLSGIVDDEYDYKLSFRYRASDNLSNLYTSWSGETPAYNVNYSVLALSNTDNSRFNGIGTRETTNSAWGTWEMDYADLIDAKGNAPIDGRFYMGGYICGVQANNFDIDDFTVYHMEGTKKVVDFCADFDSEDEGALTAELAEVFSTLENAAFAATRLEPISLRVASDRPYSTALEATELVYTVPTDSEVTLIPGQYVVRGSFYYPEYNGKRIVLGDPGNHYLAENYNNFDITATVTTADAEYVMPGSIKVDYDWTDFTYSFIILEETTLKELKFEAVDGNGEASTTICYRDIYLETFTNSLDEDAPDAIIGVNENFIADADGNTAVYGNPAAAYSEGNKYLRIDNRINNRDGLLIDTRNIIAAAMAQNSANAGGRYWLEFQARTAVPVTNVLTGVDALKSVIGFHSVVRNLRISDSATWSAGIAKTKDYNYFRHQPYAETWTTIYVPYTSEFYGYTVEDIAQLVVYGRVNGEQTNPFDIDNVKVYWTDTEFVADAKRKIEFYSEDFEDAAAGALSDELSAIYTPFVIKSSRLNVVCDEPYYTMRDTAVLNYKPAADEVMLEPGKYTIRGQFRYPNWDGAKLDIDASENVTYNKNSYDVVAWVTTSDDKFSNINKPVHVTPHWTDFTYTFYIDEATSLESLRFDIIPNDGSDTVDVEFNNIIIEFREGPEKPGFPDIGIVMVMIAKKRAAETGVRTEFIKNGKLTEAVTIHEGAASAEQSVESAGWYAKLDDTATKLTYVTEDGNSFIRVSDLDANQRGIWYNTGVVLPAGTYTFKVDLRVSETEGDANYAGYKWRTSAKNMQSMRANLQDPANIANPQYEANKPVDTNTVLNDSGIAVGNCIDITRDWTTYVDTIVLEEATLAVFKIGGGTGGEMDSHGFDIDNLSIIGYVKAE